jgi:ABC-2 type transport system permease protein
MNFSLTRAFIIARREYMTTVRRKAFVFMLLYTPAILFFSTFLSQKMSGDDFKTHFRQARVVALVDSAGLYGSAARQYDYVSLGTSDSVVAGHGGGATPAGQTVVPVRIRDFASQQVALDSLDAGTVTAVLVISKDYLSTGALRRYERDMRAITTSADDRPLRWWLSRGLLGGAADSTHVARAWGLGSTIPLYTPARTGGYQIKDDSRELIAIFLPMIVGLLLAMAIMMGGQYMLQGIAEEKETRILESLLCTVTPDDLMVGKLIGLGGAGLTLVAVWVVAGLGMMSTSLAFLHIELPMQLLVLGALYFFGGYLFYGSLMTGIGAITNNMREAQQFSMGFSIMNFFPFWILMKVVNTPNSGVAVGLSLFPPTAATTMLMRLSASSMTGAVIPMWQIAVSLGALYLTAVAVLFLCAKIFRIGLLLYGKTPNMPEILAILRQK